MGHQVKALVDGVDRFVGIDHYKRCSEVVTKGRDGQVVKRGNIPTSKQALSDLLGEAAKQVMSGDCAPVLARTMVRRG